MQEGGRPALVAARRRRLLAFRPLPATPHFPPPQVAGLESVAKDPNTAVTLFAPDRQAVLDLVADTPFASFEELLTAAPELVTDILKYHVVVHGKPFNTDKWPRKPLV